MKKSLSSYHLKLIALFAMVVDHIGSVFFDDIDLFRIVGRIAFVLYSFMLVEGFVYTADRNKYLKRLGIFAIISEVPFDMAMSGHLFDFSRQNVFFTLFFGLLALRLLQSDFSAVLKAVWIFILCLVTLFIKCDYIYIGVLQIICFFIFRKNLFFKSLGVTAVNVLYAFLSKFIVQVWAFLGLIPIWFYNGKLGKKTGLLYYWFYPLHLLILGLYRFFLG